MTPHEREQLLELAEQIILNLRSRLTGISYLNFSVSGFDVEKWQDCSCHDDAPVLNQKEGSHDQV